MQMRLSTPASNMLIAAVDLTGLNTMAIISKYNNYYMERIFIKL